MGYTQYPNTSSSGVPVYANFGSLPTSANDGDLAVTLDTHSLYVFNSSLNAWVLEASGGQTVTQMGALDGGAVSSTGGYVGSNSLFLQSSSSLNPGLVNTLAQQWSGVKTFINNTFFGGSIVGSGSLTMTGTVMGSNITGSNTGDVAFTVVGTSPSANGASLSGQVITLQPADATHPGLVSTATQTFAGSKIIVGSISGTNISSNSSVNGVVSSTNTGDVSIAAVVGNSPTPGGATIAAQILTLQAANATNGGIVSTGAQTYSGTKTFNGAILHSDGSSLSPSSSFASETTTGMYRVGSGEVGLGVAQDQTLDLKSVSPGVVNWGINSSASASTSLPFATNRTLNGLVFYQFGNLSTGNASGTVLQAWNGVSSSYVTVENLASATTPYVGGGGLFSAGTALAQAVLAAENTSSGSFIGFAVQSRTLAGERMRLNFQGLQLNGGMFFRLTGSSLGANALTMFANSSGTGYDMTWPGSQGAASTVPLNDGSGNLSWAPTLTNPMTTSGDIIVGSGSGTPARFAIGANDSMVLTTSSGSPSSLLWNYPNATSISVTSGPTSLDLGTTFVKLNSTASIILPSCSATGKEYVFQAEGTNIINSFVISTIASQSISDFVTSTLVTSSTSTVVCTFGETLTLKADGNRWYATNRFIPSNFNSYSPSFAGSGFGTPSGVACFYTRQGNKLRVNYRFISGTNTAASASMSIPSSLAIDASFMTLPTVIGMGGNNNANSHYVVVTPTSTNLVYFSAQNGAFDRAVAGTNAIFASGQAESGFFEVPIVGWRG